MKLLIGALVFASLAAACSHSPSPRSPSDAHRDDRQHAADELTAATDVVTAMDQIPLRQRERARCVLVVPSLVRAGFLLGARHGSGVATCRNGATWSAPLFITVSGGSAGLQIGVESSDVVILVMGERAVASLFRSSFAIGADVSAAAGPVGEAGQAATDPSMTAEMLSYARSRGLFAGVELSGSGVKQDDDALDAMYPSKPDAHAILGGRVVPPEEATALLAKMATAFPNDPNAAPHP